MLSRGHSGKEQNICLIVFADMLEYCKASGTGHDTVFLCMYLNACGKLGISRNGLQLLPCSPSREKRQIGQEAEDAATGHEQSGVSQLCNPGEEPTSFPECHLKFCCHGAEHAVSNQC